jgi:hypothetical protein
MIPFISIGIMYWLYQYLSRKIDIRGYEWEGQDLRGNDVKIILFNFNKNTEERINNGVIKTHNNKIYFKTYLQIFKEGLSDSKKIDTKDKETFDIDIVVLVNKTDISVFNNLKFIFWFIWQVFLDKTTKNRVKRLPDFIVKTYVLPNEFLINIDKLCK